MLYGDGRKKKIDQERSKITQRKYTYSTSYNWKLRTNFWGWIFEKKKSKFYAIDGLYINTGLILVYVVFFSFYSWVLKFFFCGNLPHATCNIQLATWNLPHPTWNLLHATCNNNFPHETCHIEHETWYMQLAITTFH